MQWRGKLEPTEHVLKESGCTREESWNLPSLYWKEVNALERKVGTYRVCTERKWMRWRGKLGPTKCVLKGNECTGEESWNLPSMYWKEECTREESWNLPSLYWKEVNALERKFGTTYRVCAERKWMHWRGKLEHTEYVLKGNECTREESWNLPSMYWKELNALERKVGTYRVCTERKCMHLERKVGTYRVFTERKWMHWRGKLEPTEYILKGSECTREESWRISWCSPFRNERPRIPS